MKRRDFISLAGGAALWPALARAQQAGDPVIGFLSSLAAAEGAPLAAAFRAGLGETGYVEGRNLRMDYRFAEGRYERLPPFAADLVRSGVTLFATTGPPAALAAKAATNTIPIVFVVGFDPVAAGLVASLNRPGGNATGVTLITAQLGQKRLELMLELVPNAPGLAMMVNPANADTEADLREVTAAARAIGRELRIVNARTLGEVEAAFAAVIEARAGALLVGSDPFYVTNRDALVAIAARHRLPAIYPFREFAAAGGLISYGASLGDSVRQAGAYAGRILKGAKPADLPVLLPTRFELVVNLKTATALGIAIPPSILVRADEIIE